MPGWTIFEECWEKKNCLYRFVEKKCAQQKRYTYLSEKGDLWEKEERERERERGDDIGANHISGAWQMSVVREGLSKNANTE